ncbi:MAG TPA: hypothetical protein VK158_00465 [Acidobacteriota bacterium]|nr:hypothetical protein [Acidobacteriota bacterium]
MQITIDLRRDETADLQKAMLLINEALSARGVVVVFDKPGSIPAPAPQSAPTQSHQSHQSHQSDGMPTSTSLFTPKRAAPTSPPPAQEQKAASSAPSSQESFNMLNMLGSKGRR